MISACVIGAVFRAYNLSGPSLWLDELNAYWQISGEDWASLWTRARCLAYSPIHGFIERAALALLGHTELALRMPSLLAGIATIPMVYVLGAALLNRSAGVIGALLVAVNVDQIYYAQQARPYALCVLLTLVSMLALVRYLATRKRRWQALYVGSTAAVITMQWVFLPLIGIQTAYWWYRIFTDSGGSRRSRMMDWLVSQGMIGLLFIPLLPLFLHSSAKNITFIRLWAAPPHTGQLLVFLDRLVVPFALTAFGVLFVMALRRRPFTFAWPAEDAPALVLLVVWYLASILLYFFLDRGMNMPVFLKRYLLIYAVPAYLLLGYGFSLIKPRSWRYAAALCFVGLIILYDPVNAFRNNRSFAFRDPEDWRGAIQYLNAHRAEEEPVLLAADIPLLSNYPLDSAEECRDLPFVALSFYRLSKEQVVPLPNFWDPAGLEGYYEQTVWPPVARAPAFWLLLRARDPAPYVSGVDAWLARKSQGRISRTFQRDFGGVSVVAYRQSFP